MTAFISICALLVAAAVALLVWPLLKPAGTGKGRPPRATIAATIVAAVLPLVAFAGYFWASDWPWEPARQAGHTSAAPELASMVSQLQQRLAQQPDDIEGWKLLGRSAMVLGTYPAARDAYAQAYTRTQGRDADVVVGYGEALLMVDEREIDGQAGQLFEQALVMAPDDARALWYGGIVAYRRGNLALAQQRWVELQNQDLPPDLRQMVAERLSEIGIPPGNQSDKDPAAAVAAKGDIRVSIRLAPALATQVPQQGTLFLIARRGEGGPPLAVVRRAVGAWPAEITMTDADSMLAGTSLVSGGALRMIARISRSGRPTPDSGDLYGEVSYDFAAPGPVPVIIDRVVP